VSLALLETLRQALGDADVIPSHHPARASPLYRAIQATVDLGQHVIAERGLPVPSSYREVFTSSEAPASPTSTGR